MDEKIKQLAKDLKLIKELQASEIYTANYQEAKALFSLGYRKESDTAKEILAEIDDLTLCIVDGSNEFEKGYFQAIADMKTAIKDLLKEKYGVEVE